MINSIPPSPDGSLDTHIYRSHDAQFFGEAKAFCKQNDDRRPSRYFRLVIGLPLSERSRERNPAALTLFKMSRSIHISTARHILNSGDPIDLHVWKSDGSILELRNCISLRYNFYGGWRNVKLLASGECRKIRDCCIFRVNDLEVFL